MQFNKLYTAKQVADILNISVSGLWAKINKEPDLKPFKLSAKQTRWTDVQLHAFIAGKISAMHH